jgi:hypothetical protein
MKSAIIKAVTELGLDKLYLEKIAELREVLLQLVGLGSVVGGHDGYRHLPIHEGTEVAKLQTFGLPSLQGKDITIVADKKTLETAAAPWRKLAGEFLKNPNVDAKTAFGLKE